jgi:hypothetical protein
MRNFLLNLFLILISVFFAVLIAEWFARKIEPKEVYEGSGGSYLQHPTLGFVPRPGDGRVINFEFDATYRVNEDFMNDLPLEAPYLADSGNIIVLGDSHTFALGVNREETYPWVLNQLLSEDGAQPRKVWNAGAIGYSLSQYLLKYREIRSKIKADWVIIGFSQATDLYDLIPPSRGGFIYGSSFGRVYHDLDALGNLIEKDELVDVYSADGTFSEVYAKVIDNGSDSGGQEATESKKKGSRSNVNRLQRLKDNLHYRSALYRMLKRSKVAMWFATRIRLGGNSLWPGLDTSLKKNLNAEDKYRLDLAQALISQIAMEAQADGARVLLVNIPYLATVYDEVWKSSFGSQPEVYDRFLGGKRMAEVANNAGVFYLDLAPAFVEAMKNQSDWLHLRVDGHPNADGHLLIADEIFKFLRKHHD